MHPKSKYEGVYWYPQRKMWRAQIFYYYQSIHVGIFPTEEQAYEAYKKRLLSSRFGINAQGKDSIDAYLKSKTVCTLCKKTMTYRSARKKPYHVACHIKFVGQGKESPYDWRKYARRKVPSFLGMCKVRRKETVSS